MIKVAVGVDHEHRKRCDSISEFGSEEALRYRIFKRVAEIRSDDRELFFENLEKWDRLDLAEACRVRGIPVFGSTEVIRNRLTTWIDLSLSKKVPASLLIFSRACWYLNEDYKGYSLSNAIKNLEETTLNEGILEEADDGGVEVERAAVPTVVPDDIEEEEDEVATQLQAEEDLIELKERKIKSIQTENAKIKSDEEEKKEASKKAEDEDEEVVGKGAGDVTKGKKEAAMADAELPSPHTVEPALLTISDLSRLATSLVPLSIDDQKARIEDMKIEDTIIASKMSVASGRVDKMRVDTKAYEDAIERYEELKRDFQKAIEEAESAVANIESIDGDEVSTESLKAAKASEHEVREAYESAILKAESAVRHFERLESMGADETEEGHASDTDELPFGEHISFEELTNLIKDTKECSKKAAAGAARGIVEGCPQLDDGSYVTMHVYENLMSMTEELEEVEDFFEEDA